MEFRIREVVLEWEKIRIVISAFLDFVIVVIIFSQHNLKIEEEDRISFKKLKAPSMTENNDSPSKREFLFHRAVYLKKAPIW
jgi:hypothetical protein